MKKLIALFAVVATLFGVTIVAASCTGVKGEGTGKEAKLAPYVSYEESCLMMATGDDYNVQVVFFRTEIPKQLDGKISSPLVKKVRISYVPLKLGGIDETVEFTYLGQTGKLAKSAIRFELVAEIETDAVPDAALALTVAGKAENVELTNLTDGAMTATEALNLASTELTDALQAEIDAGFAREINIKLIPDRLGEKAFFYYISFFASPEKFSAVLIDPELKKVVAKKI